MSKTYFLPSAKILDIALDFGRGCYLFDKAGKKYLDCLAGVGVNALGHQHPKVTAALQAQINKNLHLFGYFLQDVHVNLAKILIENSVADRVFLTNSGTESIEGALKLAKKWGNERGKESIVCFNGGFHGRSIGALSVTAQKSKQASFEPLLPNVVSIDQDIEQLRTVLNEKTTAIIFELISGEGGVIPIKQEIADELMLLKKQFGFLIIADEIQTGIGRTGTLFAHSQFGIEPDIIACAKMMGGGLPLGAFLMKEELAHVFSAGEHGSTFGGNPLACAAGGVVLDELLNGGLLDQVQARSLYMKAKLSALQKSLPNLISEFRCFGLMVGIDVGSIAPDVMDACLSAGLIVNATQGKTIRLLPPLIISETEIDECFNILETVLSRF
jgi:acetylornithine/succinyldiaminopimelate/putrescine aminotransferase